MAKVRHVVTLDEDEFDDRVFDRKYYPRKVYKDGCGPQVSLMLTDGAPDWMAPPRLERPAYRPPAYPDYRQVLDSDTHRQALRDAAQARNEYLDHLHNAWKAGTVYDRALGDPIDEDEKETADPKERARRARARWLDEQQTAYRQPLSAASSGADQVEALRRRTVAEDPTVAPRSSYYSTGQSQQTVTAQSTGAYTTGGRSMAGPQNETNYPAHWPQSKASRDAALADAAASRADYLRRTFDAWKER